MTEMEPRTEMEPNQAALDSVLRRSVAAPVPSLPPDFDHRVMRVLREQRRSSKSLERYRPIFLAGYGLISIATSAAVMRGQGLVWGTTTVLILGSLASLAFVSWAWRATHATARQSAE